MPAETFEVGVADAEIADLREGLRRTRWPEPEPVDDWSQGLPLAYAQELCRVAGVHVTMAAPAPLGPFDDATPEEQAALAAAKEFGRRSPPVSRGRSPCGRRRTPRSSGAVSR